MPRKNPNSDIIDAFTRSLEDPSFQLQGPMQARLERLKAIFARWLSNPLLTKTQMRDYITTNYDVGVVQAYHDLSLGEVLFGSAPKANKEFIRIKVNHILEKATAAALAGDGKQAKSLTKIAEALSKANRLDEPEGEEYPWDDIVPVDESFSLDPTILGIEPIPDIERKAKALLERYNKDIDEQ